jgi:hypothetical protein
MAQKMLFCFNYISAEFLIYIFGYNFCTERHILAHFCKVLLPFKHLKLSAQKLFCFVAIKIGEIEPPNGQMVDKSLFVSVDQMTVGQMSVGQMSVGQMSVGQMSVGQMSVDQMSVGQMSVGQMSVGKMSVGQMSVGQMSVGQMSVDQMSVGQMSVGQMDFDQ